MNRRLFGVKDLLARAEKSWQIAPPEAVETGRSIMLEDEFDRIIEIDPWSSEAEEKRRVFGGTRMSQPVMAYEFRDAILFNGSIIAAGAGKRIVPFGMTPMPAKDFDLECEDVAALAGSYLGLKYFGHFIHDDVPLSLLAEEYGKPFTPAVPQWFKADFGATHIIDYAKFLEIPFWHVEKLRARKLFMFDDEAYTPHRAKRMNRVRHRASEKLAYVKGAKRVFMMRGRADRGIRCFLNQDEVIAALEKEGFAVVDPAVSSLDEILQTMSGAELVVSMEGSNTSHGVYTLKSGGGMINIEPPRRFNTNAKPWVDQIGARHGFIVGDDAEDGFTCDVDRLRRLIELF